MSAIFEPRTIPDILQSIESQVASGRLRMGHLEGVCGVVARYCLNNSGISLSASDALLLVRAALGSTQPRSQTPEPTAEMAIREASPTQVALFLAGALHNVLAHFDTLPLDEYFAAAQSGNKFAMALEKINGEASSALSVAGAHSMFAEREEQADDDGGSPADTDLLKPRGNDGVVNAEICFNALLLMGDVDIGEERIAKWSDEERAIAYDWAMRRHLAASDNDDVVVPPRPPFIPVAKFGGF